RGPVERVAQAWLRAQARDRTGDGVRDARAHRVRGPLRLRSRRKRGHHGVPPEQRGARWPDPAEPASARSGRGADRRRIGRRSPAQGLQPTRSRTQRDGPARADGGGRRDLVDLEGSFLGGSLLSRPGRIAPSPRSTAFEALEVFVRLPDKVCIITGAGGGMGRVAAQRFAAEGAKVVVAEYAKDLGE